MLLPEELRKQIKGEVYEDDIKLSEFSHDASIFEIRPAVVVAPKDSEDVKSLVKFVLSGKSHGQNFSLTPRGAGTCMSGGSLTESIMVDMMPHFNKISEVEVSADKKTGYGIVEPGVFYRDFDLETKRRDLYMPAYPASRELASVGGMVGNNAGGEKTPAYGKIENFLLELSVVLADGEEYAIKPLTKVELEAKIKEDTFEGRLYKNIYSLIVENQEKIAKAKPNVSKNSAGYYLWNVWDPTANNGEGVFDLTKLIVGSQGTLGIVTKIKFRLVRTPRVSKLVVVFLKDISRLGDLVSALHSAHPDSLESYDDKTLKLVLKYFREFLKLMKEKSLLSLGFEFLPEFLMLLKSGFPKMVLMAEFAGETTAEIDSRVKQATDAVSALKIPFRVTKNERETRKYWTMRRESFSLMRNKLKGRHTAPFIDDFAVLPEMLPELLPKIKAILDSYGFAYGMAGHTGLSGLRATTADESPRHHPAVATAIRVPAHRIAAGSA
jgi:FAD/FMN-containing dehydrogenase